MNNMQKEYEIIGTTPREWVDTLGNLISGIEVVFTFGDTHQGRIRVSQSEIQNGTAKEKILQYIKDVRALE